MQEALLDLDVLIHSNRQTLIVLVVQIRIRTKAGEDSSRPKAGKEQGMDLHQAMWFQSPGS